MAKTAHSSLYVILSSCLTAPRTAHWAALWPYLMRVLCAANVNTMRGVTNNAGVVGSNQRAEGTVSADVMPSSTNQGGGIRPTVRPAFLLSPPACGSVFVISAAWRA